MDSQPTQSSDVMKHCYDNLIVVDVGANLTNKKYSRDLDSVVQRAKDSGKSIKKSYKSHMLPICHVKSPIIKKNT